MVYEMGHMYTEWPPAIYYTVNELKRVHQSFYYPTTEKLLGLIGKGADEYHPRTSEPARHYARYVRHL